MKRIFTLLIALSIVCGSTISAYAALIDRGGGMIYDTDLNITWLQDANYAMTSGYDADGLMNWNEAMTWASSLYYGGYDDWRLPTHLTVATSELIHLRRAELGSEAPVGSTWGPFINVQYGPFAGDIGYWTGTEGSYEGDTTRAWRVLFSCG